MPTDSSVMPVSSAPAASVGDDEGGEVTTVHTVNVEGTNWAFTPSVIRLKRGERSVLHVTSTEGTHGFAVPDFGINQTVLLGNSADIAIPTDVAGTYTFKCSVPCGGGHREMTGQIVIE
jgi:heme/copper-type cytochrome/quinol oxidase subunit 2